MIVNTFLTSRLFSISKRVTIHPKNKLKRVIKFGKNLNFTIIIYGKTNDLALY